MLRRPTDQGVAWCVLAGAVRPQLCGGGEVRSFCGKKRGMEVCLVDRVIAGSGQLSGRARLALALHSLS